jgi:hypothetical protein
MANARFLFDDLVRTAPATPLVNSVGTWLTVRPQTFILSPWRKKVARSALAAGNVDIILDLGVAKSFNAAFLIQPKIHTGGSVKIQANATNVWTAPTFDSGSFPAIDTKRRLTGLYFATQTFRYVRILWTNTGGVTESVELGYLMLGTYYEPTYNITDNLNTKPNDPSVINEAYDGEIQAFKKTKFNTINFFLEAMPGATDKVSLENMYSVTGKTHPLIFALDANVMTDHYFGYFTDFDVTFSSGTVSDWDVAGSFQEAR